MKRHSAPLVSTTKAQATRATSPKWRKYLTPDRDERHQMEEDNAQ